MSKMSITDAAEYFGVSKEAIHNRIRRGSLKSVVEDGIKLVIIEQGAKTTPTPRATIQAKAAAHALHNDRYYKFLEEQNAKLQSRVEVLESETRTLRDQKEQMLIEERQKIEEIYKEKDEQLKNILNTLSKQFMLNMPQPANEEIEHENIDVEIEESTEEVVDTIDDIVISQPISLKKYLKTHNFSEKKRLKAQKRFEKLAKKDERVIIIGKKYYLDVEKYDYSDLI